MACIFFCKNCKFCAKICYNYGDKQFLVRDCLFIGTPCRSVTESVCMCLVSTI